MNHNIKTLCAGFCCLVTAGVLSAEVGSTVSGIIVDPSTDSGVAGMRVSVYSLDGQGHADVLIGRSAHLSDTEGTFAVTCDRFVQQVEVQVFDPECVARGFMYGPVSFRSLSGRKDMVLNPAVFPSSADTPSDARNRMGSLETTLRNLEPSERMWATAYVVTAVRDGRDAPEYAFGNELSSVIELLRPDSKELAVSASNVWLAERVASSHAEDHGVTFWTVPHDLTRPTVITGFEGEIEVPRAPMEWGPLKIAPFGDKLWTFQNSKTYAGFSNLVCHMIDPTETEAASRLTWAAGPGDITAATGVAEQPLLVTGAANGSIIVTNSRNTGDTAMFEIGPTPTAATALSRGGELFAAVTFDGSYKVWRIAPNQALRDAAILRAGRISGVIPSSIAISPDNRVLAIGTGLGAYHNEVVFLDLEGDTAREPLTIASAAAVSKIEFTADSRALLSSSVDATTTIFSVRRNETQLVVEKLMEALGIETFAVAPSGDAAVLKVEGKDQPIAIPMGVLLNQDFDKSQFGIEVRHD